ncbi:MAG: outer membrane beta-barrel protein [Verrucomicrobia bacterium]|nr:outer membrane beta-barrel protein [Verrucomicrobiota bacterium]
MRTHTSTSFLTICSLLAGFSAAAAPAPATATAKSPYELSLSGSLGYDDDLYLVDTGLLKNTGSALTTVSAKISARFASGVTLTYTPTVSTFWDESKEDNVKHLLAAAWTQKLDAFSVNAAAEFALVDGDSRGVNYGVCGSAFSTAAPRERRDQWQNKSDLALRYDTAAGFVRGVGKLQYWDMLTAAAGTANYVDRYDIQGGLDFGRSFAKGGPECYLGYRKGYQFQDNDFNPASRKNASNRYDRYLVGAEGKLRAGLKLNAQAGWAIHDYADSALVYAGTHREEGLYTDVALTWTVNPNDELQFKTAQGRTFSSTGTNSVLVSSYQVAWKHTLNKQWSTHLTGRLSEAEYAPAARDDLDYAAILGVTYNVNAKLSSTLTASQDLGLNNHNAISGVTEQNREFKRAFVSLAANWKL